MATRKHVKCARCERVDKSVKPIIIGGVVQRAGHTGTLDTMRCPDCAGADGRASLCRRCCPTEHRTKLIRIADGTKIDNTVDSILDSWRKS